MGHDALVSAWLSLKMPSGVAVFRLDLWRSLPGLTACGGARWRQYLRIFSKRQRP